MAIVVSPATLRAAVAARFAVAVPLTGSRACTEKVTVGVVPVIVDMLKNSTTPRPDKLESAPNVCVVFLVEDGAITIISLVNGMGSPEKVEKGGRDWRPP
jgi:hypothetical protein